jgi:hypothetical protein
MFFLCRWTIFVFFAARRWNQICNCQTRREPKARAGVVVLSYSLSDSHFTLLLWYIYIYIYSYKICSDLLLFSKLFFSLVGFFMLLFGGCRTTHHGSVLSSAQSLATWTYPSQTSTSDTKTLWGKHNYPPEITALTL